jgi:glutathione peroxidase
MPQRLFNTKKTIMRYTTFFIALMFSITLMGQPSGFYSLKTTTLEGEPFDFSSLKGKKVMVVNTASKCGLTPQYEQLEALYKQYGPNGFVIIGFPANNFLKQEPGTADEIKEFCQRNYGVTFPMMNKISVKGSDMDPVYKWLTQKALNGVMDSEVGWNFQKYLIDEQGRLVDMIPPRDKPDSEKILNWLNAK